MRLGWIQSGLEWIWEKPQGVGMVFLGVEDLLKLGRCCRGSGVWMWGILGVVWWWIERGGLSKKVVRWGWCGEGQREWGNLEIVAWCKW